MELGSSVVRPKPRLYLKKIVVDCIYLAAVMAFADQKQACQVDRDRINKSQAPTARTPESDVVQK